MAFKMKRKPRPPTRKQIDETLTEHIDSASLQSLLDKAKEENAKPEYCYISIDHYSGYDNICEITSSLVWIHKETDEEFAVREAAYKERLKEWNKSSCC